MEIPGEGLISTAIEQVVAGVQIKVSQIEESRNREFLYQMKELEFYRKLQVQVGHPAVEKTGSILATVLVEASDSTKIGASAAAQAAQTMSRNASKSSSGVQYPRFFLGRLLRASAAQRISSSEKFSMDIPLGTYRRSNPL